MTNKKLEFSRGEKVADKYEVLDLLDESPLGITYRVKHLKSEKYVRLVMLRPSVAGKEQKDQIVNAFKAAKDLSHPHLVKLGELGEHEGIAYYTYEDFEAQTLRELLQEYKIAGKQFQLKEAAQIVMQLLEGLNAAHRGRLVMRALRPEYVLVNCRYTGPRKQTFVAQTKIVGVGFWDLVPSAIIAEDEFTRGEAQYLAPELKSFEPNATPRSDLYSTGVVLYEMLTGTAPVGTFQLPKARRPDLPDHINDVVELALAHAPEDRYQTGSDFIADVQRTFDASMVDEGERKPLITPIGWGLALILVLFIAIIVFALRPDYTHDAMVADSQLRKEAFDINTANAPTSAEASKMTAGEQNMIYVPPGPFISGRLNVETEARLSEPLAKRMETEGFLMDAFEFPNLQGAEPKYSVNQGEAQSLCEEAGKRLCTATEWERACKGKRSLIFAYGDDYNGETCNSLLDRDKTGVQEGCVSEFNVFDLSGNYREWTATEASSGRYLVKGGQRGTPEQGSRCAYSTDENSTFKDKTLSFRCCKSL